VDHERGGGVEECCGGFGGGFGGGFDVLGQTPVSVDPCEEAFDDPAPWQNHEAGLTGDLADDCDGDSGRLGDAVMIVAAIGPDLPDEREEAARDVQQRAAAITILNIGGVRLDKQWPAVSIDQSMALSPLDLLACIIAARLAAFLIGTGGVVLELCADFRAWSHCAHLARLPVLIVPNPRGPGITRPRE
jgi:hypothetical protein